MKEEFILNDDVKYGSSGQVMISYIIVFGITFNDLAQKAICFSQSK